MFQPRDRARSRRVYLRRALDGTWLHVHPRAAPERARADIPYPGSSPSPRRASAVRIPGRDHAATAVPARAVPGTLSRRQALLRWGGAAAAMASALYAGTSVPGRTLLGTAMREWRLVASGRALFPPRYFHAFFTVDDADAINQAAALGVNYTICYVGSSWASADPTSPLGAALLRNGMRTFLNVENPFLTCAGGTGTLDVAGVTSLVERFRGSPLVAGYWTKDDDCGDMRAAVLRLHDLIRQLDPNPAHRIMPGFGDARSVARNYVHGQADLLGLYPYPVTTRGPRIELPEMLSIVRQRTPAGLQPPPFIGIYQDFAWPPAVPIPATADVLSQVETYIGAGAIGVGGFGWDIDSQTVSAGNNPHLRAVIGSVSAWLRAR